MSRRTSISGQILIAVAVLCAAGTQASAQANSLTGIVRDSRGAPQAGAIVELLRPDFSVVGEALTDEATLSHGAIHQALNSSEYILTDTLSADPEARSASIVAHSIRSVIAIPLRKRRPGAARTGRKAPQVQVRTATGTSKLP